MWNMKGIAVSVAIIFIALCAVTSAPLSFNAILAESNIVPLPKGTNSISRNIEKVEDFPRKAMKNCYIIPGKGPPKEM